jgi:hypothetical protein
VKTGGGRVVAAVHRDWIFEGFSETVAIRDVLHKASLRQDVQYFGMTHASLLTTLGQNTSRRAMPGGRGVRIAFE